MSLNCYKIYKYNEHHVHILLDHPPAIRWCLQRIVNKFSITIILCNSLNATNFLLPHLFIILLCRIHWFMYFYTRGREVRDKWKWQVKIMFTNVHQFPKIIIKTVFIFVCVNFIERKKSFCIYLHYTLYIGNSWVHIFVSNLEHFPWIGIECTAHSKTPIHINSNEQTNLLETLKLKCKLMKTISPLSLYYGEQKPCKAI